MSMLYSLTVIVKTGEKTEYRLNKMKGGGNVVVVETAARGFDGHGDFYHQIDGKGGTAIIRLMEEYTELKKFFDAARQISLADLYGGKVTAFTERGDADEGDEEEAWEIVAQMIEEANAEDPDFTIL